jgi:hypothetical protein
MAKPITCDTPVGTPVYVVEDGGMGVTLTMTRSETWDLCGTEVVMLVGRSGGYAIERCFDARESLRDDRTLGSIEAARAQGAMEDA